MKNSRRFLALMLAFLLAFGNLSTVAMAAEGEGAGIQQTEPVSAEAPAPEAPPADAGTEAVPTEPVLEQAPAEPAQNAQPAEETQPSETPAEVPAEASSPEEAPASGAADAEMNEYSSAEAAPETEQPAAEPGVGGFKLPGMEVPEAPETEIVAPEPQADPSTNADNGIMPIATNWSVDMKLEKLTEGTEFEVGDKVTYRLTAKNTRLIFSIDDLDLTISGVTGIQTGKVEVPRGSSYTTNTTSPDGWHVKDIPVNGTVTIEFSYTITEADVAKGETLTVTAKSETGRHETASESQDVHITLKHTALKVEVTGEKKTVAYNGTTQTADQYTVTVTNKNTSAAIDSSAVSVTVDDGYKASGTDADTYLMDLRGKVKVSVNNDKVYTLDQTDVTVTDGSLTIEPANVTIIGPKQEMTYGDEKPEIGDATITGLVDPDKGEGLKVSVAGPDNYDAGEHPLAVTYDANKNYNVTTKTDGSLTVNKREITVKVKPTADVYVGDESPVSVELVEQPANLVKDHVLTLSDATGTVVTTAAGSKEFTNVTGNVKITDSEGHDVTKNYKVTFTGTAEVKAKYTITVTVANGTADPKGPITVPSGKNQTIKFTPNKYYTLGTVTVDGESDTLAADGSYTFTNVIGDHRIEVDYVQDTYTVTLHNGKTVTSKEVTAGTEFTPNTPALRDDAVFSGWATEEGGDVVYTPGTPFTVEGNTDLYAVWTAKTAKAYTCYVSINGMLEQTAVESLQNTKTSITFDLYVKRAGTDEYVLLEENKTLMLGDLRPFAPTPTQLQLRWDIEGYAEDAYQFRNISYSNVEILTHPTKGEYKWSIYSLPTEKTISSSNQQQVGSITYRVYPTYDVTLQLKKWTVEDYNTPVIKQIVKSGFHEGDRYDFTEDAPEWFDDGGHHYIAVHVKDSVLTGKAPMSIPLVRYYATDDNRDDVPDVCQTIITYKVVNGQWNDGHTEDKVIEYRFYEQTAKGGWERKNVSLDIEAPGVGEKPYVGYAEGSWDQEPPTQLKWSVDAGKLDMVFTYTYEKVYTVKYTDGVDDVEVFPDQESVVKKGDKTPEFEGTPEWAGHVFDGWLPAVADTVTEDVTYVAQWEAASYALEGISHFTNGNTIDMRAIKTGYKVFYTITDETGAVVVPKTKIDIGSDYANDDTGAYFPLHFSAKLEPGKYTITYEDSGWELSKRRPYIVDFRDDETLTWTIDTADVVDGVINAGTIEHISWIYELKFDGDGGKPVPDTVYSDCGGEGWVSATEQNIVIPDVTPVKPGYIFLGWTDTKPADYGKNAENGLSLMAAAKPKPTVKYYQPGEVYPFVRSTNIVGASKTLYANWAVAYTVKYTDGVDGEVLFDDQVYVVKKGATTPAFEGGEPTREGYEFAGWEPTVAKTVTKDITYVAQWKVYTSLTATIHNHFATKRTDAAKQHLWYTITNADGEVVVPETEVPRTTSYPQMVGATVVYGDNAVYESKGLIVTVPIQLEKALPAGDYTITYRLDGWQNLSVAVADTWVDEDTLIHTFTVAEDEGKDSIDAGTIETWTYEYKLIFDGNGGAPVPDPMYGVCASCDPGFDTNKTQNFVIPDEVPQKEGYVFIGWTDTKPADYGKNGENGLSLMAARATPKPTVKYYQPGDTYQIVRGTSIAGATVTLYANWEKACTVTYTDGVDDKVLFPDQVYEVKKGANAPAFDGTPTREHYDFIGWATTPDGNVEYAPGTAIKVTGDLTLYAVWEVRTYKQDFYGYVDGLYQDEVESSAFELSRTLSFEDGTEITFDKDDTGVEFGFSGSPSLAPENRTTITIKWTVDLPETLIGAKPKVTNTTYSYGGNAYVIESVWKDGTSNADSGMPEPGKTSIGLVSVMLRSMTSYYKAEHGTISSTAPAWSYYGSAGRDDYVGKYDFGSHIAEYSMPHEDPYGATAKADPGYVFKGWYTSDANGKPGTLVTPDASLTAAVMAKLGDAYSTLKSNQRFVPVFEKVTMAVVGGEWEYEYKTFYPTVTFAGADGETFTAAGLGLTVQYSTDGENWSNDPIGAKHVLDSKTVYVQAVDASNPETVVFGKQEAVLTVKAHPITVRTLDEENTYSGNKVWARGTKDPESVPEKLFFEYKDLGNISYFSLTSRYITYVGEAMPNEIHVSWRPATSYLPGLFESDYDVTYEYGTVSINPIKIHIGTNTTKTVPYNGEEQVFELSAANITRPARVGMGGNPITEANGYSSRIAYSDTLTADFRGTEPGVYDTLNWKIVNTKSGEDMSRNYIVTYEGGLTIDPVITVTVKNGTAVPGESPVQVAYGEDQTITFTAGQYYELESVTVDGEPAELDENGSYTFSDVIANHSIEVVYKEMIRSVTVEYYYNGVKGYAPADKPTKLEGQVGTTVVLTPDETLKLTYGRGTSYAESYYELDRDVGSTYEAVVQEDGSAVIKVYYKNVMVTGTGRLNIVGLPNTELLPKDATLSFTVKWDEVKPNKTGGTTAPSTRESVIYTFGELLDMNCIQYDDNGYHFNVPITVAKGGKVTSVSVSDYDKVYGYKVVMTTQPSGESNKINEDGYSVGMLYTIQYADKGEHTVTIHYLDKLTGEPLQPDFVSESIHGDDTYDFSEQILESIEKDGVVYHLFVANLGGSSNLSKAAGTMNDKDIEITAYYSPDKNGDDIPDAAQVFLTFHVVNGAWNDEMKDDVTKTVDVYKFNGDKNRWEYQSVSCASLLPAVGDQPDVGFLAGYNVKNWDFVGSMSFTYRNGGQSVEYTYTYVEDPNFIPTASVSVEDTTYGTSYEPETTTPTGPHGAEYTVDYTYYAVNADGSKGEALDEQPTDAGSYIVEATWTAEGRPDVTAEARFTIAKKAVTVTADNKSKVYGESDPDLTFTVPADALVNDDTAAELGVELMRESGEDVKTYAITGTANSSNYAVTVEKGTLTITKRPVTLTSADDTKEYDGKPLTNETVTVSGDGFAEGEGAAYSVTGSQTLVGSSANEFTYTLNENTKADNYEITTKKGTLTVTDRTEKYVINMQPNGGTATYDGEGHSASGFAAQSFTVNGQSFTVEGLTASASGTNADTYPVQVTGTAMVRDADGNDVTKQFNVTYGSASLVIGKAAVTVKPVDASKVYDGEPLTVNAYEVTAGRFYGSDAAKYTFTYGGSQTVAGSSASSVTVTLKDGEADNYTITAVAGTLAVTDRGDPEHPLYAIGMQPIGGTATYDGAPHSAGGFAAQSFTVEGKTYTVEGVNAGVTATNAGTYPVQITGEPIVRDAEGNDVTKQFNVTYGSASLVIGRKAVTVTANNAGKVYGTNDPASFTAAVTGLVGSDRLNYSVTREAGENVGTYAIIPGGAAVQGNYDVTYVNGAFTITSQAITGLTVNGPANVVYDGAAHQWAPTVTGANGAVLQAGRDYNVAYNTGNFTDAGTVNVTITGTGNYSGSVTRTYQITPRAVTLTSATATKVYDGAALTAGNVTAEGFVPGEGAAFNVTGGRTIVGTSLNTFTYTLNANTNAANYVIGQTFGTLTVTPAALAVNVPANIVYDGAAHQWAPTVTGVNGAVLQAGRDYNVAYGTGNFTDAGTVNVTVTGAGNYTGTVTRAYTITPRDVTLTSASATRAYNGAALTAGNVTAEGFADGEGATYNVTGRRTIVGTSLNAFTYTLNANTDADNYNISRTFGTLTVTPAALTVNVPANTVYDGTAHQWVPTVTGANGAALQAGRDYNVAYSTGNFTDAGTVNVTITGAGNYTGTVTRTYTITPRDVTLTSASATKVYDGTALTAGNVTAQGFAPGEGATYNVTGRRTIVGTSLNAFTYTLNANTDAGNYNISRVFGRLVVTQAEGPAPDEGPNGPGNGPDNGPGNGPDNDVNPDNEANTADITEDEVPLGGEPEIEAASEDIPEDDVPMGALPDKEQEYSLSEEVVISEDETPLGAAPTEADCCILHFILMLCALGVAVYYTYDRKRHQKREFELRSELK